MTRNLEPAGVPILGQRRKTFVCGKNHVDELPGCMTFDVPNPPGPPIKIPVCRLCMMELFGSLGCREATPAELEIIEAEKKRLEKIDAEKAV